MDVQERHSAEVVQSTMQAEPPVIAELVPSKPKRVRAVKRVSRFVSVSFQWLVGLLSLIVGLAILATIPILQFLSLGYFLEASGRIARTGKIRNGLIGVEKASRLGSIALGTWLCLLPARFVSSMVDSSLLINGESQVTGNWRLGLIVLIMATIGHVVWAWFRGGKFRHFVWPAPIRFVRRIRGGNFFSTARDTTCDFLLSLHLDRYFVLGMKGFAATIVWLVLPVSLLALSTLIPQPVGALAGILGSLLLAAVVMYLPFLQTRYAESGDFAKMFDVRQIRRDFKAAPIAFWISLIFTLIAALPLYLLKAELIPREAAWLPSLVFVVFMFPSRLVTGWAIARANRREQPRHFVFRWSSWLASIPVVAFYVGFVFLTQYVSWYGRWSLYEQHAFLLPVPFLGM